MTRTDPDYAALTVANRVLGGTMGRLFRHLREEKGYTYGIGSGFSALEYRGSWTASTSVRTEVTEPALTDLLAEIAEHARQRRCRPSELDRRQARDRRPASRCRSRTRSRCSATTSRAGCTACRRTTGTPTRRGQRVTAAQAQAAAAKYRDPSRLQIVAVGDAKITEILKKKGPLELYDADGKMTP